MEQQITISNVELTADEKQLCDYFLEEYEKDFDYDQSCIRMGIEYDKVARAKSFFLSKPYVQQKLAENQVLSLPSEQGATDRAFRFVVSKLKKIAEKGNNRDKLGALDQISKLYKLTNGSEQSAGIVTNVMQIPTGVSDAEWEDQAQVKMADNMRQD